MRRSAVLTGSIMALALAAASCSSSPTATGPAAVAAEPGDVTSTTTTSVASPVSRCDRTEASYPWVGPGDFQQWRDELAAYVATMDDDLVGAPVSSSTRSLTIIAVHANAQQHQEALDAINPGVACVVEMSQAEWDAYTAPPAPPTAAQLASSSPDRLFTGCFDLEVDPAIFDQPGEAHLDDHPANAVFDQTELPGVSDLANSQQVWRAYESDAKVLLVNEDNAALLVIDDGAAWGWAGSGGCQLASLDRFGMLPQPVSSASIDAERVSVAVATSCTGAEVEELVAVVEQIEEQVVITVLAPDLRGFGCQVADAPLMLTVELDQPLAGRTLLDGSTYPPTPIPT